MSSPDTKSPGGATLPERLDSNKELEAFLRELPRPPETYRDATARAEPLRRRGEPAGAEELAAAVACVDLTMLTPTDQPADVRRLARRAVAPGSPGRVPPVAGVAVHTDLVGTLAAELADSQVRAVCPPGGFPHGRAPWPAKEREIRWAIDAGAQELDVVIDRGRLLAGDFANVVGEMQRVRELAEGIPLKVILETADLPTPYDVQAAAWLGLLAGADFVKTSTGMARIGATAASAWLLAEAAHGYAAASERTVGVKLAGGLRTVDDAVELSRVVGAVRGETGPPRPSTFRLGASGVLESLVERLEDSRM